MLSFLAIVALIACVNAAPGVPVMLQIPLNSTLYPNGLIGNTTKASTWQIVPIDQFAFMIPTNALSFTIEVDSPEDGNNVWWAYDISSVGPLCQLSGDRDASGYTCGGLTEYADHRTNDNYNFTWSAAGASQDGSGFRWAVGTYYFFGFTSDTSYYPYPITYNLRRITLDVCPTGYVGGVDPTGSFPACVPLQVLTSNSTNFFYNGNVTGTAVGMAFEMTVPANVGAFTITITVPQASASGYDAVVRGASMGFPSSYNAECNDYDTTSTNTDFITTLYCLAPAAGRYYVHLDAAIQGNFTGNIAVNYTICSGNKAGGNCQDNLIDLGNVVSANNMTTYNFVIPAGNTTQYKLTVPVGTTYDFNITFSQTNEDYVYANINNYASTNAYPNSNWRISASDSEPFNFQAQQNALGNVYYFFIDSVFSATTVNITISSTGSALPSSTTTSTSGTNAGTSSNSNSNSNSNSRSTSASGSRTGVSTVSGTSSVSGTRTGSTATTTAANSDSSILAVCVAMSLVALVF